MKAHLPEFEGQACIVRGLQQARADSAVDFDGSAYDAAVIVSSLWL